MSHVESCINSSCALWDSDCPCNCSNGIRAEYCKDRITALPKSGTQAHTEQPSEYRNDICEASYLAGLTDLRAQLASSLILSPVDLAGEIEEGEYLCIWEAVHSKLGLNADVFPSKLVDAPRAHGVKILRAYGPLPEPGKE